MIGVLLAVPAVALADTSFVTAVNLNGAPLRNDFTGKVGTKITVGASPITVTQLGRYFVSGNSGTHLLELARASDGVTVASVSINMGTGTADSLGFKYATLGTPATLSAGSSYYVVSNEVNGGDQWYDYSVLLTPTGVATIPSAVYYYTSYVTYGSTNNSYGPVNFQYTTGGGTKTGTYYINNQAGSNCNDANPGTSSAAPWCTFGNVNSSTFGPGAQILLARGATWYQAFRPSGSGSSVSWIAVDAYGSGARPIVRGNSLAADRGVVLTNADYWTISNLEISNVGFGIVFDYTTLNHQGLRVKNVYAHDISGIVAQSPAQSDFPGIYNSVAVSIGGSSGPPSPPVGQWIVKDVVIDGLETYNTQAVYVLTPGCSPCTYTIYPDYAVQNLTIKNSYFHTDPYPPLSYEATSNSYFYSNHVDCSGHVAEPQGTTCYFLYRTKNITVANNILENLNNTGSSDMSAVDFESYIDLAKTRGNWVGNNAGPGLEWLALSGRTGDYGTNNEVYGNTFVNNGTAGSPTFKSSLFYLTQTSAPFTGAATDNLYFEPTGFTTGPFTNWTFTNNISIASASYIFNGMKGYSTTQGTNGWSYQYYNGSSYSNLSYDSTNQVWGGPSGSINRWNTLPDTCNSCWFARAWTATSAGTVSIRGRALKNDVTGGDGVKVKVTKNGTTIWPTSGTPQLVGATDLTGYNTNLDSLSVAVGDVIRFEVNNAGAGSATSDLTSWGPTVAYTAIGGGGGTSLVTAVNLNGAPLRNDFTGKVGTKITVGASPITVTQLGRYFVSGNSGTHLLELARASDGVTVASVSINMGTGTADSLGFKYATLGTPATLSAGSSYYIVSNEVNGGDQWRDYSVLLTPTGVATIPSAVYYYTSYVTYGSTNNSYGPVNLKYS